MLAKLSPASLMLMKGHVSVKSLAAIAVFTACMPGPSLAAAKWAECTTAPNPKASIINSYKVELKTNSDKVSVIRDTVVIQEKLDPKLSSKSAQVQIIAPASWFPTEVVIGPFDGHPSTYTSDNGKSIILVCETGGSSPSAGETLKKEGYKDIYILRGGINQWKMDNLPLV